MGGRKDLKRFYSLLSSIERSEYLSILSFLKDKAHQDHLSDSAYDFVARVLFIQLKKRGKKILPWRLVHKFLDAEAYYKVENTTPRQHVGRIFSLLVKKGLVEKKGNAFFLRKLEDMISVSA